MAAAYVNLEQFNILVALAIATTKATLVVLFFMHAKFSPQRTKLVIIAGIFWLALLLFMTLSDYASRIDYRGVRFPMTYQANFAARTEMVAFSWRCRQKIKRKENWPKRRSS